MKPTQENHGKDTDVAAMWVVLISMICGKVFQPVLYTDNVSDYIVRCFGAGFLPAILVGPLILWYRKSNESYILGIYWCWMGSFMTLLFFVLFARYLAQNI